MSDKRSQSLIFAGTVFSISTTLGQVIAIESLPLKLFIGIPNLLVWLYVLYCYATFKPPKPTRKVVRRIKAKIRGNLELKFKTVQDKETLKQLWKIDQQAYGDYNINFDTFLEWWTKFPLSNLVMMRGSTILGSVGILPLTEECFEDLKELRKREQNIHAQDIMSVDQARSCRTWYISGIMLVSTPEQTFHLLISQALRHWLDIALDDIGIFKFLALAYTKADQDLLLLLGFQAYYPNPPKGFLPVYYRGIESKTEIIDLMKSLNDTDS